MRRLQAQTNTHFSAGVSLPGFSDSFCRRDRRLLGGIGAILLQLEHPIEFYSKKLSSLRQKASIYAKELWAVTDAMQHRSSQFENFAQTNNTNSRATIFFIQTLGLLLQHCVQEGVVESRGRCSV